MTASDPIEILFIDDDEELVKQVKDIGFSDIDGRPIRCTFATTFDEGIGFLVRGQYDVVVSDVYQGRVNKNTTITPEAMKVRPIVEDIRQTRFAPIVLISDGPQPNELISDPFVLFVDKGASLDLNNAVRDAVKKHIDTGIPDISRKLHRDIDSITASYVWGFIAKHWKEIKGTPLANSKKLGSIIRRRTAVGLSGELGEDGQVTTKHNTASADYYLMPPLSKSLKMGSLLKKKDTEEYRIVLTPHCDLITQPGDQQPRADFVLLAKGRKAQDLAKEMTWDGNEKKKEDQTRRRIGIPAQQTTKPNERHFFLPAFATIPDLYFDVMNIESIAFSSLAEYETIAEVDSPFSEAIQSALVRFYSRVGLPMLNSADFLHLSQQKAQSKITTPFESR